MGVCPLVGECGFVGSFVLGLLAGFAVSGGVVCEGSLCLVGVGVSVLGCGGDDELLEGGGCGVVQHCCRFVEERGLGGEVFGVVDVGVVVEGGDG